MDWIQAMWLGILQGITEFLPISSSAHLILVPKLLGWKDQGLVFDLSVHVGTLLAVLLYFRHDLKTILFDSISSVGQKKIVGQGQMGLYMVLATIPTGFMGLLLMDLVETSLRSLGVMCVTTLVFGLLLGWADWKGRKQQSIDTLSLKQAMLVGLAQTIALVPGVSRSGITITAGLMLGLTREAASRFSFLLAIPITGLAASVKIAEFMTHNHSMDWMPFVIGGVTSFITAITAIHYFLKWLNQWGFWPYVVYRVILAGVLAWVLI
jgi:undecaprenyl-diphosphatase